MKSKAEIIISTALALATYLADYLIRPDATKIMRLSLGIAVLAISYAISIFLLDRLNFNKKHIACLLAGLVFLAIGFFLPSKASAPSTPNKFPITVLVTDESGGLVPNALVTLSAYLDGDLKLKDQLSTDNTGIAKFELASSLRESIITIEVEAIGYIRNTLTPPIFDSRIQVQLEKQK